MNPAFNRWATAPNGPHYLLLPFENADLFTANLQSYPLNDRIQWRRYLVNGRESLNTIASKVGTTSDTLKRINRLDSGQLHDGKSLVIPIAPKGLNSYLATLDNKKLDATLTKNPKQKLSYTVQDGDTLWGIAQEYNVKMQRIAEWNNMEMDDVLFTGKKLTIWANDGLKDQDLLDALIPTTFAELPKRAITRKVNYRVRSGDSLGTISKRFNVTVQQLRNWNKLSEDSLVTPGQKLTLFVDVTRQSDRI